MIIINEKQNINQEKKNEIIITIESAFGAVPCVFRCS